MRIGHIDKQLLRRISKLTLFLFVFSIALSGFTTSVWAKKTKDPFNFSTAWDEAIYMNSSFIKSVSHYTDGEDVWIQIEWKNDGQYNKTKYYSFDKLNVLDHQKCGDKTDKIKLGKEVQSGEINIYIILKEGNNGTYKKYYKEYTIDNNPQIPESIPDGIVSSAIRSADAEEYGIGDRGVIKYEISGDEVKLPESLMGVTEKEIVLVIDTSGSMGNYMGSGWNRKSRMEITKSAAKNFVNKFSHNSNVKIGIVAYSEKGHITSDLKLASDYSLITKINSLRPDSATNTGDGLRLAYWMLKNSSNSNAKKYVVSMTDGDPTFRRILDKNNVIKSTNDYKYNKWPYTSDSFELYTGSELDSNLTFIAGGAYYQPNNNVRYIPKGSNRAYDVRKGTTAWSQENERCLQYAELIGRMIASDSNMSSYVIGFSSGVSTDKLQRMAIASGAKEVSNKKNYASANSENDLEAIYEDIADKIIGEIGIEAQFKETLPEGIEIDVNNLPEGYTGEKIENKWKIAGAWNGITLKLQDNEKYKIDDSSIEIPVTFTQEGNYILNNISASLSYNILGNNDSKNINFNEVNIRVIDKEAPTGTVSISSDNTNNTSLAKVGDTITLNIETNEPIETPNVTIAGKEAIVSGGGTTWTATYIMAEDDQEGEVPFTLDMTDLAGNRADTLTQTADGNFVTFDKTAPIPDLSIASSNNIPSLAKVGDNITLNIEANEDIQTPPTVTIAGNEVNLTGSGRSWTAIYTMAQNDNEGKVVFTVNMTDLAGNRTNKLTDTTDDSSVEFDKTAPDPPTLSANEESETTENVIVTIAYPDDAAIKKYRRNEDINWSDYTESTTIKLSENGTVYAKCSDRAGNESQEGRLDIAPVITQLAITDGKNATETNIIKNGTFIAKIKLRLNKDVHSLKINLSSQDMDKFKMKEIKLMKDDNKYSTNFSFDNDDPNKVVLPQTLTAGVYECFIKVSVRDENAVEHREENGNLIEGTGTKYTMSTTSIDIQGSSATGTQSFNQSTELIINVVKSPEIL